MPANQLHLFLLLFEAGFVPAVLDDENIVIHDEYTEDPKNNDPNCDAKANNDGNNDMGTSVVSAGRHPPAENLLHNANHTLWF